VDGRFDECGSRGFFFTKFKLCFAYAPGSIAYLAELMHLLGKSHGAVKNDIQNKINRLLRSGKRRRDTSDNDNIPPIVKFVKGVKGRRIYLVKCFT
jgi:hypothetical protein